MINAIVKEIVEYSNHEMIDVHINLREEMAFELARIISILKEKIVADRIQGRSISSIDPKKERDECFSCYGIERINNTAKNFAEGFYLEIYRQRWKPKTLAALAKEKNPKKNIIIPKPVERNHFIPKSFIKKYWSEQQSVFRNRKDMAVGSVSMKAIPVGSWGYEQNLYTDYLEAYFGLVEGDAARPIEMILNGIPLNSPQRESLVGFIVIQYLRNPLYVSELRKHIGPIVAAYEGIDKSQDDNYMKKLYEALYSENELYDKIARPILWSKWAMVRAENPLFVLPDISVVFGFHQSERYVFVPLTPKRCLIVLPERVSELRVVPYNIEASTDLLENITDVLEHTSSEEFLSSKNCRHQLKNIDFQKTICDIFESLDRLTSEDSFK